MLILKNLELVSTDGKNPLYKQQKTPQLSFRDIGNKISEFEQNFKDLKESVDQTNHLLEEIKDILSTGTVYSNNEYEKKATSKKMYIPSPDINTSKTSKKETKNTITDSNDLTDTLKSLTEITGGEE